MIFIHFLKVLIENINPDKPTIICGDFNIDYNKNKNLTSQVEILGFNQLINVPTHIQGNIIDHFYIRYPNTISTPSLHPVYYSDHDAICVYLKKSLF